MGRMALPKDPSTDCLALRGLLLLWSNDGAQTWPPVTWIIRASRRNVGCTRRPRFGLKVSSPLLLALARWDVRLDTRCGVDVCACVFQCVFQFLRARFHVRVLRAGGDEGGVPMEA